MGAGSARTPKIVDLMAERVLGDLEHDAEDGARPEISEDDSFTKPADEVRECKQVQSVVEVCSGEIAVLPVVLLARGRRETRVEPLHKLAAVGVVLPEKVGQRNAVEDVRAEDRACVFGRGDAGCHAAKLQPKLQRRRSKLRTYARERGVAVCRVHP